MFEYVQKHKRWLQIVLLILIVPPFALFGIDFYFRDGDTGGGVARVGKMQISEQEYSRALRQAQDRMREMMRENTDPAMFNSPQFKESVLNELIERNVALTQAHNSGMAVPTSELQKIIGGVEAFRDETGRFSRERYRQLLQSQGMTPEAFESQIRSSVMLEQLRGVYATTGFVPDSVLERLIRIREQKREVSQVVFNPAEYLKQIKVSAADAEKYYNEHLDQFKIPERVRAEFVVLSADAAQRAVQVGDEELRKAYQENLSRFQTPEERSASHILITAPATASAEDKAKAKALADDLLGQVKAAPAKFAELARKHSQDPGSAEKGGDLGSFGRGLMVKPFDDAVFAMQKTGEIAGPVETQYGYHIIRLDGIKGGQTQPFEKVKGELAEELRKAKAGKAFAEAADSFNNLVYEQYDSLQPAADALKLGIQKSDWIGREGGNMNPLLNNPKLLAALFSDEVLKNKHNTAAIEVQPGMLIAARVIEHKPAEAMPFKDVVADIQQHLAGEQAMERAKKDGEAALEKLRQGGEEKLAWSRPQMVSLQQRQGLHPEGAQAVFGAETAKLPAYVAAAAPQGRYVIYRISKVEDVGNIEDSQKKAIARQLAQMMGQEQYLAYVASLRERTNVKIDRKKLEQGS